MISELDEKYFPSLRLPRKIYNTEIRVFAQFRVFPSCFDPVLLNSRPASDLKCFQSIVLLIRIFPEKTS